jgi:hypothetical protein
MAAEPGRAVSGPVVVDAGGEVFGEAPNVAARVYSLAELGSVLVSPNVQPQVAGRRASRVARRTFGASRRPRHYRVATGSIFPFPPSSTASLMAKGNEPSDFQALAGKKIGVLAGTTTEQIPPFRARLAPTMLAHRRPRSRDSELCFQSSHVRADTSHNAPYVNSLKIKGPLIGIWC